MTYTTKAEAKRGLAELRGWPGARILSIPPDEWNGTRYELITADNQYFCDGCTQAVPVGQMCGHCYGS